MNRPVIPVQLWIVYSFVLLQSNICDSTSSADWFSLDAQSLDRPSPQQLLWWISCSWMVPHQYVDVGLHWAAGSSQTAVAEYSPPSETVHETATSEDITNISSIHHRMFCFDFSPVMMQTRTWDTPGLWPARTEENSWTWTDGRPVGENSKKPRPHMTSSTDVTSRMDVVSTVILGFHYGDRKCPSQRRHKPATGVFL